MKKYELDDMITAMEDLSKFADKQPYNEASIINQQIIKVLPLLKKEKERIEIDRIQINCPQIFIITYGEARNLGTDLISLTNKKLEDLIKDDYKIIDFNIINIYDPDRAYSYIKYTN